MVSRRARTQMYGDQSWYVNLHHEDLLKEAAQARLADQLVRAPANLRRPLARACHRLADWLDAPDRYSSAADSGRSDWVRSGLSA
jgi:hypothetical protein